jgi:predicted metal-binding membrane protein
MGGMDAGPGTELGGLGWFAVVWVTMMAAMMFPSIAPMVLAQARVRVGVTPAFVAALIAAEKLLPWKEVASRGIVALLAVLAAAVAFAPQHVPGLTIPGSPAAMDAMERMGTESMQPARPTQMEDRTPQ